MNNFISSSELLRTKTPSFNRSLAFESTGLDLVREISDDLDKIAESIQVVYAASNTQREFKSKSTARKVNIRSYDPKDLPRPTKRIIPQHPKILNEVAIIPKGRLPEDKIFSFADY